MDVCRRQHVWVGAGVNMFGWAQVLLPDGCQRDWVGDSVNMIGVSVFGWVLLPLPDRCQHHRVAAVAGCPGQHDWFGARCQHDRFDLFGGCRCQHDWAGADVSGIGWVPVSTCSGGCRRCCQTGVNIIGCVLASTCLDGRSCCCQTVVSMIG